MSPRNDQNERIATNLRGISTTTESQTVTNSVKEGRSKNFNST